MSNDTFILNLQTNLVLIYVYVLFEQGNIYALIVSRWCSVISCINKNWLSKWSQKSSQ